MSGKVRIPSPPLPCRFIFYLLSEDAFPQPHLSKSNPTAPPREERANFILPSSPCQPQPELSLAPPAPSNASGHAPPAPSRVPSRVPTAAGGAGLPRQRVRPKHRVPDSAGRGQAVSWGSSLAGVQGLLRWVWGQPRDLPGRRLYSQQEPALGLLPWQVPAWDMCQLVAPSVHSPCSCQGWMYGRVQSHQAALSTLAQGYGAPQSLTLPSPPAFRSSAMAKPTGSRHGPCCSQPASARSGS